MSDFVAVNDTLVHVVEHGPARPRHGTIVLLHGFPADHRLMTGAFEPVLDTRDGWRRVYLDLPGMGRSVAGRGIDSTDAVLAAIEGVLAKLVPDGRVLLAGESYGGYLSQGLIATNPDRYAGLCLVAPAVIAEHARRQLPPAQTLVADPSSYAHLTVEQRADVESIAVVQDAHIIQRMQDEILVGLETADDAAVQRISAAYAGAFEASPVERFDGPSLLIAGRQDNVVGFADQWALLQRYPRMTYAVLDRAGHNVHLEQDVILTTLVHEWLDRVEESLA